MCGTLGGAQSGPSPVDRARPGRKHHVLTDAQGIPLAVSLTGGKRNDFTQLLSLLDKFPAIPGTVGRPRHRPDALLADRGYNHDKYCPLLSRRGMRPVIAERGQPHGSGLGIFKVGRVSRSKSQASAGTIRPTGAITPMALSITARKATACSRSAAVSCRSFALAADS